MDPIRDSAPDDLRALAAKSVRPPAPVEEMLVAPSFLSSVPLVMVPSEPVTTRPWITRAVIVASTLALSAVALAAVPAMLSTGVEREPARAHRAVARSDAFAIAPRAVPAIDVVVPEAPAVPIAPRITTRSRTGSTPPAVRHTPRPAPTSPTAPAPDTLDPALASALDSALDGARADTTPAVALPTVPTTREVSTTLRALERRIAQCREAEPGATISARIAIDGATGTVHSVDITGARGTESSCIAPILETARFPRFAQDRLVVTFPYRL